MAVKPTLTVTSDFSADFNRMIKKFKGDHVLVGIPEEKTERKPEDGQTPPINNATILAINQFGSPAQGIPARPVMSIGIRNAQDEIVEQFKIAIKKGLSQGVSALNVYYNRAGIIASNSIKKAINSQEGIEGPAEATLAARKARGFKGEKALIVTGQMRNSITYVVKEAV